MNLTQLRTKRKPYILLMLIPIILTGCQQSEKDIANQCQRKAYEYYNKFETEFDYNKQAYKQAQTIYDKCIDKAGITDPLIKGPWIWAE